MSDNQYQILEELGRGAMGFVHRARDTSLDRDVAIKILKPELSSDEKAIQRFKKEAAMAASLWFPVWESTASRSKGRTSGSGNR